MEKEERIVENIQMSGKEYLLYLREQQDAINACILECFQSVPKRTLSEQELVCMIEHRLPFGTDADDPHNMILEGVVRNLLGRFEAHGQIISVCSKEGHRYRLTEGKSKNAA